MTDDEEFAARSQLKWTREGNAWILLYRRRRMGRVRARLKGIVLGPEWLKQIAAMTYDDNPFTLPPDLELSVEDAKRIWPL